MSTFARAQLSALTASVIDLLVTVLLVEAAGMVPGPATLGGNLTGAGSNFLLNRRWTFRATAERIHRQALRYALVWCGYLALSYGAMVAGTQWIGASYLVVKVVSAVALGIGYNYVLHKRFVYA